VLTMQRSNAVIAAPCDKPMIPSYWFFDNSSDHHFTWPFNQYCCPTSQRSYWMKLYTIVPSVRCVHIVLQIVVKNPPGSGGRLWCITIHRRAINVVEIGDVGQSIFQREGIESKGGR
jgi:hypothetical protein